MTLVAERPRSMSRQTPPLGKGARDRFTTRAAGGRRTSNGRRAARRGSRSTAILSNFLELKMGWSIPICALPRMGLGK